MRAERACALLAIRPNATRGDPANATGNIRGICSSRVLKEWRNTELQRPQRTDQPILGSQLVIVPYRQKYTYTLEVERATPLRPAVPPRPGNSYLREKKTP